MIGNISTTDANQLLRRASAASTYLLSQRTALESKLFPVTAYNSVACAQIYRGYQYKIFKQLADHISPEEIGARCRTLASYPNILGMWAFIGLWGLGRMQDLYDAKGAENELPERRQEAKFLIDFWYRMATSYYNSDKPLAAENNDTACVLPDNILEMVKQELQPITPDQRSKLKRTIAQLHLAEFLSYCECRASIHEMGPYPFSNDEVLIFREFSPLYDGSRLIWEWHDTEAKSPIPNISVALILKDMDELVFTDFATLFAKPEDYSEHIQQFAFFTRYDDKIETTPFSILSDLEKFATDVQTELYLEFAKWDDVKRLKAGSSVFLKWFYIFTDMGNITDNVPMGLDENLVGDYIEQMLGSMGHPAWARLFRSKEECNKDPSFYELLE
ncbi:MAG: hypothetical protein ACFFD8_08715 [Candidatus Thorarchaeota archaeon]